MPQPSSEPPLKKKFRSDYAPPHYWVREVQLDFQIYADKTEVRSKLTVEREANTSAGTPLELNGENITIQKLSLDGVRLTEDQYKFSEHILTIPNPPTATRFVFEATVVINPETNTSLRGLYRSGKFTYCTQCEAEGFRCITFMADRPDVLARYTQVRIEAEQAGFPVLLSNGNKITEGVVAGSNPSRHFVIWEDPFPKPCYLFAVVAGDLGVITDSFRTCSGRDVALRIFGEHQYVGQLAFAMRCLKQAMKWDEDIFGLEYDLELYNIVAVRDFVMGAMENKSLNVFATSLILAKPEVVTDLEMERIQGVIGHEYFHNWTGNRITCRDWFQLTLKEGLTVYRDQTFSSDVTKSAVKRIETVRSLRASQFSEDEGPLAHPIRPESYVIMDNFYTYTVYYKGAEVIRMIETIVGKQGFRKGMDRYIKSHDGQAVTCDDFRATMATANGVDLTQFERWYGTSGTPVVEVVGTSYDAATRRYTLRVSQRVPPTADQPGPKPPLHIPMVVGLLSKQSGKEILSSKLLEMKHSEECFVLENVAEEPVASLFRNFSAPIKLLFSQSDEDLALLMAHDTDAFVRWDSGQRLYTRVIVSYVNQLLQNGLDSSALSPLPRAFVEAIRVLVESKTTEKSLQAYALTMPGVDTLINEQAPPVNVDAIYQALTFVLKSLSKEFQREFEALYDSLAPPPPKSSSTSSTAGNSTSDPADAESIGRRRLRGVALRYLSYQRSASVEERCWRQYTEATTCMTEKMQALTCLADLQGIQAGGSTPSRYAQALQRFYADAGEDEGVIDKWFRVQAMADVPDVISQVRALMTHPKFALKNPARMRALLVGFIVGNPARFHAKDGSGYELLGEIIPPVDKLNPQVGSYMVSFFSTFKKFDSHRVNLLRAQLERIAGNAELSQNSREMVEKMLAPASTPTPA